MYCGLLVEAAFNKTKLFVKTSIELFKFDVLKVDDAGFESAEKFPGLLEAYLS